MYTNQSCGGEELVTNKIIKMEVEETDFANFVLTSEIEIKEEEMEFSGTENMETLSDLDTELPVTVHQGNNKSDESYKLFSDENKINLELTRQNLMSNVEVELPSAEDLGLDNELVSHNIQNLNQLNKDIKCSLSNMCRICGRSNKNNKLKDIFASNSVLPLLIGRYLPVIKVCRNDELPLKACLRCCSTITAFHEMQQRLDNTQRLLQSQPHADSTLIPCRVCGQASDNMMYIFSKEACVTFQLPMLIAAYLPQIKVSRSDTQSLNMLCIQCRTTLHSFNIRKQQYVAVEDKMKAILRSFKSWKTHKLQEVPTSKATCSDSKVCNVYNPVLQEDPTTKLLDCVPPKPPYKCVIKSCVWNSRLPSRRGNIKMLSQHYRMDHNKMSLCEHCLLVFHNHETKANHVRKWHMIPCNICSDSFLGYTTLNEHRIKLHSPTVLKSVKNVNFQCEYCISSFCNKSLLHNHLKVKHCIFKSLNCNQEFNSESECNEHDLENHNAFCSLCDTPVSSDRLMKSHVSLQHKNQQVHQLVLKLPAVSNSFIYTCKMCNRKLSTKNNVKHHYFWFHKKYACEYCLSVFPNRELESLHYKQNHESECVECHIKFNTSIEIEEHLKSKHSDLSFCFCEYCGTSFNNRDLLENHRMIHTLVDNNVKPGSILCDYCGKFHSNRKTVIKHQQLSMTSGNNISNTCQYCDRKFKTLPGLNLHITLKHTGITEVEKNFQCKICMKYFKCFNKLEEHEVRHYKYKCDLCNIQYMLRLNLEEHVQEIHHHPVAYKCIECGKILCSEQGLNLHVQCAHINSNSQKNHVQIPVLKCHLCLNVFLNKKILKSHMIKRHMKGKRITNIVRKKPMGRKPYLVRI